jgi:exodeoxyribonuclease V beta subunit
VKTLNPYSIPLKSINLIEASAGTGKSWTVSLLVLRLLLEKNLTLDQILVVTFTEAATKELRNAVRSRILEALAFFQNPSLKTDKKEYAELYNKQVHGSDDDAILRLRRAKLSIDEAAIFTIHSFCQRALTEYAFEASLPFESELMDDDSELMQKLTDDFWRKSFTKAPKALLYHLQNNKITPDSLLKDIRSAVGKPYLKRYGPSVNNVDDSIWQTLEDLFKKAIEAWQAQGEEVKELLLDNYERLHQGRYKPEQICEACEAMDALFDDPSLFVQVKNTVQKIRQDKITTALKGNQQPLPEIRFFKIWQNYFECLEQVEQSSKVFISTVQLDLLDYLQCKLPLEKRRLGVLSFDDLLLNLQQALEKHPQLSLNLSQQYKAALIDEFQDTDPIQYDIFSRIYKNAHETCMFLVGDPKQAIYRFRGGDIHTYLKAKVDTDEQNRYTLKTNWRSHPDLVTALNTVYENGENCFKDQHINYIEVDSGLENQEKHPLYESTAPLRFWKCDPELNDKGYPVEGLDGVKQDISDAVAGDIAATLNDENLNFIGCDIAILVRSHNQGTMIKEALNAHNIASVQSSKDSIFETYEAVELLRILKAIVEPQREDQVRRALVTEIMGYNADDLIELETNTSQWETKLAQVQQWHIVWKEDGFLTMFNDFLQKQSLHQRLLSFPDGERRLTNLLQLSELIHHAAAQQSLSMEEVLRWLENQQENTALKESELRLESDSKLVKIVTIWKAKGLEYPIVYCPFVGLNRFDFNESIFSFYNDNQACLEIGSNEADAHKVIRKEEEDAEETRLLYVALTRAKYQCTIVCFPELIKGKPDKSSLGWLLSKGQLVGTPKEKKAFSESYQESLMTLSKRPEIAVEPLPINDPDLIFVKQQQTKQLTARSFDTRLKPQAQITSFSGLTAGAHAETPDHDAQTNRVQLPPLGNDEFPRGPTAGSALHEVYENIDFTVPLDQQQEILSNSLLKWGYTDKHLKAANQLMENSLKAKMAENLSLDKLNTQDRLNEMEFHLPLAQLELEDLKQILFQHLPKSEKWKTVREAVNTLHFDQVKGYLKGFIDLIFVYDKQYYVADYKSNTLLDYHPENLMPVMADSHYYLQYLLYSVALHRYLSKRIPGYQWESHIGGVYYLFIRGMVSDTNTDTNFENFPYRIQNNLAMGVFFDKPSLELIEALDGLFTREVENV